VQRQTLTYKRVAGREILADVYSPEGEGPRPVVVWIHGGGLVRGGRDWFPEELRDAYLKAGFVMVSPDYRFAPQAKLPEIMADVQDALAWVREAGPGAFGADPARIGVVGASAGAHLALLTGYLVEPRPRAIVSFYGYGDIVGAWTTRPDSFYSSKFPPVTKEEAYRSIGKEALSYDMSDDTYSYYVYLRQQGRWSHDVVGRDPETEPEAFVQWCPLQNVDAAYPPTLLVHGTADSAVPYEQSVLMAEALDRAGVAHELITVPGGGHGFDADWGKAKQQTIDRSVAFLREYV